MKNTITHHSKIITRKTSLNWNYFFPYSSEHESFSVLSLELHYGTFFNWWKAVSDTVKKILFIPLNKNDRNLKTNKIEDMHAVN